MVHDSKKSAVKLLIYESITEMGKVKSLKFGPLKATQQE